MPTRHLSPFAASVLLAGVAIAWGAIPLFVRNDVPSAGLVGVRVTFGAIALVAFAAATRRLRLPGAERWRVVASGLLLTAHWVAFFAAIKLTTVAIALAVMYLGPIAAAVLSGPILGERVPPRLWLALAIAAIGTVLMIVAKPASEQLGGLTLAIGELTIASVVLAPATVRAVVDYPDEIGTFLILGVIFTGIANVA